MSPASTTRDRVALAAVVFVVLLAQVVLYPGIAGLVAALGASTDLDASMWFLVAEFSAFVVCASLWGVASDRAGRRVPFIAIGALGGATGYLLLAVLPGAVDVRFAHVLAIRVAQGAMTIAAFSLAITMLMDLPGGHGKNMGAAGIAIGLGTASGAPLGGRIAAIDPLFPLWVAGGLLLAVVPLLALVDDRAPDPHRRSPREIVRGLARTPTLGLPYAFGFVDRLTAGFFALVGVFYFQETFGIGPAETGIVLGLFFAPFALLQYPMGVLSDRIGRTIPIVIGSICYGGAIVLVGTVPTLELAQASMVLVGVLGALVAPATMALVTDLAGDDERGLAMAGFNIAGSLGFLTGFLLGGTVASTYGYLAAFLVVGGLEVLIAAVAVPLFLRVDLPMDASFQPER
ncbi:MFS transporter [Halalkalicoccus salilacus]|uniref:MFS transporter n=1 Tax=Halalkalicoccus salilacus TaxID=3117459 RepID=UPI00300EA0D6